MASRTRIDECAFNRQGLPPEHPAFLPDRALWHLGTLKAQSQETAAEKRARLAAERTAEKDKEKRLSSAHRDANSAVNKITPAMAAIDAAMGRPEWPMLADVLKVGHLPR